MKTNPRQYSENKPERKMFPFRGYPERYILNSMAVLHKTWRMCCKASINGVNKYFKIDAIIRVGDNLS